jgi:hypothetical protein
MDLFHTGGVVLFTDAAILKGRALRLSIALRVAVNAISQAQKIILKLRLATMTRLRSFLHPNEEIDQIFSV